MPVQEFIQRPARTTITINNQNVVVLLANSKKLLRHVRRNSVRVHVVDGRNAEHVDGPSMPVNDRQHFAGQSTANNEGDLHDGIDDVGASWVVTRHAWIASTS